MLVTSGDVMDDDDGMIDLGVTDGRSVGVVNVAVGGVGVMIVVAVKPET